MSRLFMVETTDELRVELLKRSGAFAIGLLVALFSAAKLATDAFLEAYTVGEVGGSLVLSSVLYGIPFALAVAFSFFVAFDTLRAVRD